MSNCQTCRGTGEMLPATISGVPTNGKPRLTKAAAKPCPDCKGTSKECTCMRNPNPPKGKRTAVKDCPQHGKDTDGR